MHGLDRRVEILLEQEPKLLLQRCVGGNGILAWDPPTSARPFPSCFKLYKKGGGK